MSNDVLEVTAEVIEPTDALQVAYTPATFKDNLEVLSAYVDKKIEPYIGAEIDPENAQQVKEGRACMAELNKLKEPIEAERKRVKKIYEAPLKEFEGRVKQITSKIDGARDSIKKQVDEADSRFRDNRRAVLEEEYIGCAGAIADVIPFSAIFDEKWLNRSVVESKAIRELYERVETALAGYDTLQTKELKHKDEVVKHYADTLDLIAALELEDRLNEEDRKMAEFKAAQEAARMVKEERIEEPPSGPAVIVQDKQDAIAYRWHLSMDFTGSREFAERVGASLKAMGITGATIKCMGVVSHE